MNWPELFFSDLSKQESRHRQNREDDKKDFSNVDGTGGYATKTKQGGNQSDDKEHYGVMKHGFTLSLQAVASLDGPFCNRFMRRVQYRTAN
jgi:hypothetical protein